jgi:prepilin-type N-terminal cleavage/methylation domain-containing protein/prepilin-type processing-associated H-X9-DG protein
MHCGRFVPSCSCSSAGGIARGRLGFTLVELLVVIGIIAVLVGLLLPSLGRAREQARCAACLSNLRQLAVAANMYADDNRGRFPAPGWIGDPLPDDWNYWEAGLDQTEGVLMKYLGGFDARILTCPSDDVTAHIASTGVAGASDHYLYSYSFNESVFNHFARTTNPPTVLVRTQIINSSEKMLVIDEDARTIDDGCWWANARVASPTNLVNVLSNRHYYNNEKVSSSTDLQSGRGNAGFCDGHCEAVERADSSLPHFYDPTVQ